MFNFKKIVFALLIPFVLIFINVGINSDDAVAQSNSEDLTIKENYQSGPGLPVGKIQSVWGTVAILHTDMSDAFLARVGLPLFNGDTIITTEQGGFGCKLNDGSAIKLSSNSQLKFNQSAHSFKRKSSITSLSLYAGRAFFKIAKLDGFEPREFRVETDAVVAGGRQAIFMMLISDESTEIVALNDSLLEIMSLQDPEQKIFLSEYQRIVIEEDSLPSTVEIIPQSEAGLLISKFRQYYESELSDPSPHKLVEQKEGDEGIEEEDIQEEEIE
jgi:hypothetical protein